MQDALATPIEPMWAQPGWLNDVTGWVHEHVARAGMRPDGSFELMRSEPWSIVFRVPVHGGSLYFKQPAPIIHHEVAVSAALARLQPHRALPLLAYDVDRAWMLMPDGGETLRPTIRADRDLTHWDRVLEGYAALQIDLAPHIDEFLSLGVPDRRLERLPELLCGVLDDTDSLLIGQENGVAPEEYERAQNLVPVVRDLANRLASFGIPPSLHHGDFHDANIFYDGTRYTVFDWSECAVTHPFFSLRTAMVSVINSFDLEDAQEGEVAQRLWQGYAPAWQQHGSPSELQQAFDLARRLWSLPTLLSWYRIIDSLEGETRDKFAYIIPAVLQELLAANEM